MGGFFVVLMFAMIISQFLFRAAPPHKRAILTAGTAWALCAAIWGLLIPSGFYGALVGFSIGATLVGVERYIHYSKHWIDGPADSDIADTFR